jgi:ferrochelatase
LGADAPPMEVGMMFTPPSIATALGALTDAGCDHVVAVGLFPHWSFATTGSATDMLAEAHAALGPRAPRLHVARAFFDDPTYLRAVAATVRRAAATLGGEGPVHLLFSAHGVPASFLRRGDPYADHVQATVRGVVRVLDWTDPVSLSWQSRLGPVRWLGPSTPEAVARLGAQGVRRLLVVPVSFVGEHIETLDELDKELAEDAHRAGITSFGRAPALGMEPLFLDALTNVVRESLAAFDRARCVRCLLPVAPDHHRKRCLDCGFTSTPGLAHLAACSPGDAAR